MHNNKYYIVASCGGDKKGEEEAPGVVPQYELLGFVQHRGTSIDSGHYVAYIKVGESTNSSSHRFLLFTVVGKPDYHCYFFSKNAVFFFERKKKI
tara:strand:- start:532 stop:816 length:285 start_codon:yes stop_codon:yes gene_type:complete